jgi:hypothetical protein
MIITASEIYARLIQRAGDGGLTLQDGVTENDVQSWYDGLDIQGRKKTVNQTLDRSLINDIHKEITIAGQSMSVADVIRSRDDDPSNFDCAYILRSNRTFVQYRVPQVAGKHAMSRSIAEAEMSDHVERLVARQVSAALLDEAVQKFST